jgi:hypothetical protein
MKLLKQEEIAKLSTNYGPHLQYLKSRLEQYLVGDLDTSREMLDIYSMGLNHYRGKRLELFLQNYPRWSDYPNLPFGRFTKFMLLQYTEEIKVLI